MNFEEICNEVKEKLSEKRYIHSLGVMEKAQELAMQYGCDVEMAKIVGITHDIAKEMSKEEAYQYVKENNIQIDEIEKFQAYLLHGKIGADICKKKYNFNQEMQKAIINHTTGTVNMGILEKIIYLADKIEENRTYEGVDIIRKIAKEDLDKAILQCLDNSIMKTIRENKIIHPNTIYTRNSILIKEK